MAAPKFDHALRQASQKFAAKTNRSMQGQSGAGAPKFYQQSGKASTAPKPKK